jgi:hypothetical protein
MNIHWRSAWILLLVMGKPSILKEDMPLTLPRLIASTPVK